MYTSIKYAALLGLIWKKILSTHYVPGTVSGTRNTAVDRMTKISALLKLTFWWGTHSINKLNKIDSMITIRCWRVRK